VTAATTVDRPSLWLRATSRRSVLLRHLDHVAGSFAAAGWNVGREAPPNAPHNGLVAVMDDPWVEPLPAMAVRLGEERASGPAAWRVPLHTGASGPQAWQPRFPPATWLEYERCIWRRAAGEPIRASAAVSCGFAVAAAGDADRLLAQGWPPEPANVVIVRRARMFRYPDPADHDRGELAALVPDSARTIVDVGCGTGRLGSCLRRPGRFVVGVEPEWELAQAARRVLDGVVPLRAEEAMRTIRGAVDCFVFADVLEHMEDPVRVLRAAGERMTSRGALVVSIPNAAWAPVLRALAAGRWDVALAGVQARDHLFFTTPSSFARLAAECGLVVERSIPLEAPLAVRQRLWAWLAIRTAGGASSVARAPQWAMVLRRR
jgi:2-polyprenyl-3-methyl-5-hydroxy-6-metoxy-1,4-benzoquinol methylase